MIAIRLATQRDMSPLMALVRRAVAHMLALGNPQWDDTYPTAADFRACLEEGHLYVAEHPEGALLGAVVFNTQEDEAYEDIPWSLPSPAMVIHKMVVDPEAQRQGVATAFFSFGEALARQQKLASVRLDTYTQNERMQYLLQKQGYVHVGHVHFPHNPLPYPCFEKVL